MLVVKTARIALAAAAVAAVPAAAVTPLINYAQFFQLTAAKDFSFTVGAGSNTISAVNSLALMIAQAFVKSGYFVGQTFVGTASLSASSTSPMIWNGVSWEQEGYAGTFNFTGPGGLNVLTLNFMGGVFTRTTGTTPTVSLLAECPCGITWSSDVFELRNPQDYAFTINALAGAAWTDADKSDPNFRGRDFVGTGTGSFAAVAIPEPATWGLLISGFGLIGLASRRRRTSVAA